jgi:UDP-N-acetyl-D-glucosamine dehydrogenase
MKSFTDEFIARVEERTARVGVVGLGYVGLPLALTFVEAGFRVVGVDSDEARVETLRRGESTMMTVASERVASAVRRRRLLVVREQPPASLRKCDAILICVPTPLGSHREPDLSFVERAVVDVGEVLRDGQLVVLESTSYPGTTDGLVRKLLASGGKRTPTSYLLAFSPEREDPGNRRFETRQIPKVVGGVNRQSTRAAVALYAAAFEQVVPVSSARVAESCKLLENVFRSVNIALVNECKVLFEGMDVDIWEVIEAAKTKPFGFMPFYPGPGLGGHCIPLDPFYLSWKAAEMGQWARFVELAGEINTRMPARVVEKIVEALNDEGKPMRNSRILILGLAYKPNIDDDRESPSYEVASLCIERGAKVEYCDPVLPGGQSRKIPHKNMWILPVGLRREIFARYDVLVLATAHDAFKDPSLYVDTKVVVDTRNLFSSIFPFGGGPRVVKA